MNWSTRWAIWFRWTVSYVHRFKFWFAFSVLIAGIAVWSYDLPELLASVLWAYFSIGWKVYVALISLTFFVLETYSFQSRRAKGFRDRRLKYWWHVWNLYRAVIWPLCWADLDSVGAFCKLENYGFVDVFCDAFAFWFSRGWRPALARAGQPPKE